MGITGCIINQQEDGGFPSTAIPSQSFPIRLINGEHLARELLFKGPNSAFRKFCKDTGIQPVPGRKDCYDPIAVRLKLNEIQGIGVSGPASADDALSRSIMRRNG